MFYLCKLKEKADQAVFELYKEESQGGELMENNHTFLQLKNFLESAYEYKRKTESIRKFKETVLNEV